MSTIADLLAKVDGARHAIGAAREAYRELNDAMGKIGTVLSEKDKATLLPRLEAVHAESMAMSSELEQAANERIAQLNS
jgi:hypothetical protein